MKKTVYNGRRGPNPTPYRRTTPEYPSGDSIGSHTGAPTKQEYSGAVLKGIGLLHKSNYVPVTAGENMDPKKHTGGTE